MKKQPTKKKKPAAVKPALEKKKGAASPEETENKQSGLKKLIFGEEKPDLTGL